MNILPFALSFLLLMSLLAGSLLKEVKGLALESRVCIGSIHSSQQLCSHMAEMAFKEKTKTPKKPPGGTSPTTKNTEPKKRKYERTYHCKTEWDKFQLRSILDKPDSAKSAPAQEVAVRLIEDLYSHTTFWKKANDPNLARKIVDKLALWKEGEVAHHFATDPQLSAIFHAMLMGTNTYDIKDKKGYPPFFDFFTLAKEANGKAVVFQYASFPVLQAAIGAELLEQLKRKEGSYKIFQENFKALVEGYSQREKLSKFLQDLFYFDSIKKTTTLAKDSSTEVTMRVKPVSYLNRNPSAASVGVR